MKNKLVFRIIGALASALIIASVFIPFVSVTGYSQSLWQNHQQIGTLYLPIMIIVFGAIGVLVFSTNFKTELAYTSTGALLFFLIMQTITIVDQNAFGALSVGYYCLAVGTILTGVMAFLSSLRKKVKEVEQQQVQEKTEMSMIEQIDKLYNDQSMQSNTLDNESLSNIIQPIPVQNNAVQNDAVVPNIESEVQPVVVNSDNNIETQVSLQNLNNPVSVEQQVIEQPQSINTAINDFNIPQHNINVEPINTVVAEFSAPENKNQNIEVVDSNVSVPNPVVSEFSNPAINNQNIEVAPQTQSFNPIIAEFSNSVINSQNIEAQSNVEQALVSPLDPIQPLNSQSKVDIMADQKENNTSNLDIFG